LREEHALEAALARWEDDRLADVAEAAQRERSVS